jgi:hypothetical protein
MNGKRERLPKMSHYYRKCIHLKMYYEKSVYMKKEAVPSNSGVLRTVSTYSHYHTILVLPSLLIPVSMPSMQHGIRSSRLMHRGVRITL